MTEPQAYYNEVDPYAAQHLRNLIAAGELPDGVVDERDIRDVQPSNLDGFTQCHFFAGVGIWAKALRSAGWRDDQPVWTGSCPCQPLSAAGKGLGFDDERHLWPDWHWLIEQCRPETVLGEQVASHDGLKWADLVQADLEGPDYAFGPVDTCAAGFGGYHIRQRLYFAGVDQRLANATGQPGRLADGREWQEVLEDIWRGAAGGVGHAHGSRGALGIPKALVGQGRVSDVPDNGSCRLSGSIPRQPKSVGMADLTRVGRIEERSHSGRDGSGNSPQRKPSGPVPSLTGGRMADTNCGECNRFASGKRCNDNGPSSRWNKGNCQPEQCCEGFSARPVEVYGADADWLFCRDGKWRPVEPATFPLADAYPGRVGELRAYGNALDLGQATAFVRAHMERHMGGLKTAPAGDLFEWGVA